MRGKRDLQEIAIFSPSVPFPFGSYRLSGYKHTTNTEPAERIPVQECRQNSTMPNFKLDADE